MVINNAQDGSVYTDIVGLEGLKTQAKNQQGAVLDKVVSQFEGIFLQMALQAMRNATAPMASDLFNSNQMQFYQDMFDKQLALSLSGGQFGIGAMLKQQLQKTLPESNHSSGDGLSILRGLVPRGMHSEKAANTSANSTDLNQSMKINSESTRQSNPNSDARFNSKTEFVQAVWGEAKKAAEALGVHPAVLIAQAALETDWGRKIIKHGDGNTSFNLFNIKAGGSWDKDKVYVKTLEYRNGVVGKERAAFRSYGSFMESFMDYIHLLKNNSRYSDAVQNSTNPRKFLEGLQAGGYATDPHYAKKILNIMDSDVFQSLFSSK